jgi:hypothetical protein
MEVFLVLYLVFRIRYRIFVHFLREENGTTDRANGSWSYYRPPVNFRFSLSSAKSLCYTLIGFNEQQ